MNTTMEFTQIVSLAIVVVLSIGGGCALGFFLRKRLLGQKIQEAEELALQILKNAEREAETKRREAGLAEKDALIQARGDLEKETRERRAEIHSLEKRLDQREENLERRGSLVDKKEAELQRREKELSVRERAVAEKEDRYERGLKEQRQQLEKISGMTAEAAKRELLQHMEDEAKFEAARMIKRIEDEAKENAERKAKEIIATAIQRYAADYVIETTTSTVPLPNEEMKGRIIGREGRNIRALEAATGVDLIIDDTPESVVVSSFDPLRREIARIALEKLITDGRIHPTRIEEVVDKVKKELDKTMTEEAEKILFELGIQNVHPEIVRLLGRLKYRTSYGQNNLMHAREAAHIAGLMASELGLDVKLAKRAALLHDIGKVLSHEMEGGHAEIGIDLARKYGESPQVVNAIAYQHENEEALTPEAVLVAAADAISGARPGARRESVEAYIKRLTQLEGIAQSFKGVEKTYAIQAGRELRVIVKQSDVSDAESAQLSRDLAKKIEKEMAYPGQIKITVIRESRYVEYAR